MNLCIFCDVKIPGDHTHAIYDLFPTKHFLPTLGIYAFGWQVFFYLSANKKQGKCGYAATFRWEKVKSYLDKGWLDPAELKEYPKSYLIAHLP